MPAQEQTPGNFISGGSLKVASFSQTNLGLTRPKHHIQFHSPMSVHKFPSFTFITSYPKMLQIFDVSFFDKYLTQLYTHFSSCVFFWFRPTVKKGPPRVLSSKNREAKGSRHNGIPTSRALRSRPLHRAPWLRRKTAHRRRLGRIDRSIWLDPYRCWETFAA